MSAPSPLPPPYSEEPPSYSSLFSSSSSSSAWDYTTPHPRGGCVRITCSDGDLWYWWNKLIEKCPTLAAQPDAMHYVVPFRKIDVLRILRYLDTSQIGDVCAISIQVAEWFGFQAYTTAVYEFVKGPGELIVKGEPTNYRDTVLAIKSTNRYNTRKLIYFSNIVYMTHGNTELNKMARMTLQIMQVGMIQDYAKLRQLADEFTIYLNQTNVFPPPDFTRIDNSEPATGEVAKEKKRPAVEDIAPDAKRVHRLDLDGVEVINVCDLVGTQIGQFKCGYFRPKGFRISSQTRVIDLVARTPEQAKILADQIIETPALQEELARRMGFTL